MLTNYIFGIISIHHVSSMCGLSYIKSLKLKSSLPVPSVLSSSIGLTRSIRQAGLLLGGYQIFSASFQLHSAVPHANSSQPRSGGQSMGQHSSPQVDQRRSTAPQASFQVSRCPGPSRRPPPGPLVAGGVGTEVEEPKSRSSEAFLNST